MDFLFSYVNKNHKGDEALEQAVDDLIKKEDIHSAVPSWSGFVYQGKVAIYTALHILNNVIEDDPYSIDKYSLVIEDLEDFVIFKNNRVESIHQVKAKPKNNTIGQYNEANLLLLGKIAIYPHIKEAILHTATELKEFSEESLRENIKNFDVSRSKKAAADYQAGLFDDSYDNYTLAREKLKIASESNNNDLQGVIELEHIEEVVKEEIKKIYQKLKYSDMRKVEENIQYIYANFLFLVENSVHRSHLDKQKIIIEFTELKNILDSDSIFDYTTDTASLILLHSISNQYDYYIEDYDVEDLVETSFLKKWKEHLTALYKFNKKDFYTLCTRLTPHKAFNPHDKVKILELMQIAEPTGVKDVFFRAILETEERIKVPNDLESAYILRENGKFHSVTTLTDQAQIFEKIGAKIFKNIEKSSELFPLLFDIDVYITSQLNNEYKGTITNVKADKSSNIIEENDNRQTIVEPKTIKFIDIETFIRGDDK